MGRERNVGGKETGSKEASEDRAIASETEKSDERKSGIDSEKLRMGLDADFVYYDEA